VEDVSDALEPNGWCDTVLAELDGEEGCEEKEPEFEAEKGLEFEDEAEKEKTDGSPLEEFEAVETAVENTLKFGPELEPEA
jgi:hypothetical protein